MNAHHELNVKDIEIIALKLQNEKLQNDLRREREIAKSFNKPNEAIKYFEQLLKSPRPNNDTSGLGCVCGMWASMLHTHFIMVII